MNRFECLESTCKKTFIFPAKLTAQVGEDFKETHVCPYCNSMNIQAVELKEPAEVQEAFQSISFEPKMAPEENSVINQLLAQGYQITERFSKSVNLIKLKPAAPAKEVQT